MKQPRKPPAHFGRPKDPDDDWNVPEIDLKAALAQAELLCKKITDASPSVWKRSFKFLDDISQKAASVCESIKSGRCSPAQQKALNNWEAAVDKLTVKAETVSEL